MTEAHSMSDRLQALEERLRELREDVRTIDKAHLDRYHSLKTDTDAVKLLIEATKRMDAALNEHDDRLTDVERLGGSVSAATDRIEARLTAIEQKFEAMNIAVLASQVKDLRGQVRWMIVSFVGMILSILGGIIVFLITQVQG